MDLIGCISVDWSAVGNVVFVGLSVIDGLVLVAGLVLWLVAVETRSMR